MKFISKIFSRKPKTVDIQISDFFEISYPIKPVLLLYHNDDNKYYLKEDFNIILDSYAKVFDKNFYNQKINIKKEILC